LNKLPRIRKSLLFLQLIFINTTYFEKLVI